MKTCSSCRFLQPPREHDGYDGFIGECHRHAPGPSSFAYFDGCVYFPPMMDFDWCGEHESAPEQGNWEDVKQQFSPRLQGVMSDLKIQSLSQLAQVGARKLLKQRNIGPVSINQVNDVLRKAGLNLSP